MKREIWIGGYKKPPRPELKITCHERIEFFDDSIFIPPIRQDIEVLPANNPAQLRLGWVVNELVGVTVVNPNGVNYYDADIDIPPLPLREVYE